MTTPSPSFDARLALARIRVLTQDAAPLLGEHRGKLAKAAELAGRRLVDASGHGISRVTLGWQDGAEPPTGDPTCPRQVATQVPLVTLAAVIRACWPDPHAPLFPGQDANESEIVAAVQRLAPRTAGGEVAIERHVKGALGRFRETGYLTSPVDDPTVYRLGPVIAAWTTSQVAAVAKAWSSLPFVPEPTA